jgi:hypothetical protein
MIEARRKKRSCSGRYYVENAAKKWLHQVVYMAVNIFKDNCDH